jgi:hypothetical protein
MDDPAGSSNALALAYGLKNEKIISELNMLAENELLMNVFPS